MNTLKRFKTALILLGIWLCCFVFYLLTPPAGGYATTPKAARALGGFMYECSGGVIEYGSKGYQCDGYAPKSVLWAIILVGLATFVAGIIAFPFYVAK